MREYGVYLPLMKRPTWKRYHEQMRHGDHLVMPDMSHAYAATKAMVTLFHGLIERGVTVHLLDAGDGRAVDSGTSEGAAFFRAYAAAAKQHDKARRRNGTLRMSIHKHNHVPFFCDKNKLSFHYNRDIRILMGQIVCWRNSGMTLRRISRLLGEKGVNIPSPTVCDYDYIERAIQSLGSPQPWKLPSYIKLRQLGRELWRRKKKPRRLQKIPEMVPESGSSL